MQFMGLFIRDCKTLRYCPPELYPHVYGGNKWLVCWFPVASLAWLSASGGWVVTVGNTGASRQFRHISNIQ